MGIITRSSLHTKGFTIYSNVFNIDPKILNKLKNIGRKHGKAIFNYKKNDNKRKQVKLIPYLKTSDTKLFLSSINKFLNKNYPNKIPDDWYILYSKEGCQDQLPHCDYEPTEQLFNCNKNQLPLAVLVSLEPKTKLNVWPRALITNDLIKPIKKEIIELNEGDILIFRGDLVHSGSKYDNENFRLHCFLDDKNVDRQKNRTWIISKHASNEINELII